MSEVGKKIVDINPLLDLFEAQEGEVQHIIGKTGQGKTYEATRRALLYLFSGHTVYTTWILNLPEYYDEREHWFPVIRNLLLFRKNFFRFDLKNNWKYVNLDDYLDEDGAIDTQKLSKFLAGITDAIFMMDEGQDVFDARERAGKAARQSITRTRHMHKTLILISQRAMALDVTARGNVTFFYKCVKTRSWPWAYFKVYRTEDIDEHNSMPLWSRHDSQGKVTWQAPLWRSAWARKWVYDAYDSWYMRKSLVRSQYMKLDGYTLTIIDRFRAFFRLFRKRTLPPMIEHVQLSDGKGIPSEHVDNLPLEKQEGGNKERKKVGRTITPRKSKLEQIEETP